MVTQEKDLLWWLLETDELYTIGNYSDGPRLAQHASGYINPIAREQVDRTLLVRMKNSGLLNSNYRPTLKAKKEFYA